MLMVFLTFSLIVRKNPKNFFLTFNVSRHLEYIRLRDMK